MGSPSFRRLALLNIASNLTAPLASLIDVAFLGHANTVTPLAGVALATVLFDVLYFSFSFLRMATTGLTAQVYGSGLSYEPSDAGRVELYALLYRALGIALCSAALVLVLQVPLRAVGFGLLSGTPEVEQVGMRYFDIRIWAVPAAFARYAMMGWFLGIGRSGVILIAELVANLCNVGLDDLFIRQWSWGAEGAAWATLISQYVASFLLLLFLTRHLKAVPLLAIVAFQRMLPLLSLSRDIFIRTLFLTSSFAVFTNVSAFLGTQMLAANTLLLRCFGLVAFVIDGFAYATETLVGQSQGAGDSLRLTRTLSTALKSATFFAALVCLLLWLFGEVIIRLLTVHESVVNLAMELRYGLCAALFLGAFAWIYDGVFFGLGQGELLRNVTAVAALCFAGGATAAWLMRSGELLWIAFVSFMGVRGVLLHLAWTRRYLPTLSH